MLLRAQTRAVFRQLHLFCALLFGLVFVLSGLTGSILAWQHELDSLLNPDLFQVTPPAHEGSAATTDSPTWLAPKRLQQAIEQLAANPRYGRPTQINLPQDAGQTLIASYRAAPAVTGGVRQVMLNPHTLTIVGERNRGETGFTRRLLLPTLFHLHHDLLAGEAGKSVIGIAGLVLLLMSLLGVALWWPDATRRSLRHALTITHRGSWPRFNYSFHRTAGFIAAPVLILFGFSGWYFNLPKWVVPLVNSVASVSPPAKPQNRAAAGNAMISAAQAMQAAQARFPGARVTRIALPAKPSQPYEIRVRQPGELRQRDGATRVTVDAWSGQILAVQDPLRATGGDRFLSWLFPLHNGEALGLAGRIFVSGFGLVPLLFGVTGVAIWLRRQGIRHRLPVKLDNTTLA